MDKKIIIALITCFYRNTSLVIIVYSIDNFNTINNIEIWLNEIKTQSNPEIKTFLIGNKANLEAKDKYQLKRKKNSVMIIALIILWKLLLKQD